MPIFTSPPPVRRCPAASRPGRSHEVGAADVDQEAPPQRLPSEQHPEPHQVAARQGQLGQRVVRADANGSPHRPLSTWPLDERTPATHDRGGGHHLDAGVACRGCTTNGTALPVRLGASSRPRRRGGRRWLLRCRPCLEAHPELGQGHPLAPPHRRARRPATSGSGGHGPTVPAQGPDSEPRPRPPWAGPPASLRPGSSSFGGGLSRSAVRREAGDLHRVQPGPSSPRSDHQDLDDEGADAAQVATRRSTPAGTARAATRCWQGWSRACRRWRRRGSRPRPWDRGSGRWRRDRPGGPGRGTPRAPRSPGPRGGHREHQQHDGDDEAGEGGAGQRERRPSGRDGRDGDGRGRGRVVGARPRRWLSRPAGLQRRCSCGWARVRAGARVSVHGRGASPHRRPDLRGEGAGPAPVGGDPRSRPRSGGLAPRVGPPGGDGVGGWDETDPLGETPSADGRVM